MKKSDPPPTGTAYRIPRGRPGETDPRVRAMRALGRKLTLGAGIAILVILCFLFPRVLAFVELAAREIRILWWLIAILAMGIWLTFFFGKKKDR